jgi:FAD/FMN-containing dehydrogenase
MSVVKSVVKGIANLSDQAVAALRAQVRGELIQPGEAEYDGARKVYNAMIDKHPALIVRCVDVADVISAVNFAREQQLTVAVRGGGHNGPGFGTVDDGLVIDLSRMRGVRVDPADKTVRVEGGCLWGDVDHATHAFGLAVPCGFVSSTGVGGLTLGGGIGYLARKYGLSIDNLLSVDMVLADGRFVTASLDENPDLFWAVRGGGGNFGVVTSFLFRGTPVHTVYGGPMIWPLEVAADLIRFWQDLILRSPDDLNGWFGFITVPPAAPFPEQFQLQKMCVIVWCYTGPLEKAEEIFKPGRIGQQDTAWSNRDVNFAQVVVGVDPDPKNNARLIEWAKDYWLALHPFSAGGGYVNMIMDEGQDLVKASYGDNYAPLMAVKAKYDPHNFFRVNQNIKPAL